MDNVSQAAPPFYPLTESNHGALVVVTAIVFYIYAILGIIVCVIAACSRGLGEHRDAISEDDFVRFSKLMYASRILAILVHATTKISLGLLIRQIDRQSGLHFANMVVGGVVIVWAVSGAFTTAFACPMPEPWLAHSSVQCPSQGPIFIYNGTMIILTDIALCILPVAMMWGVQTSTRRKLIVVSLFSIRLLVPIMTIPELTHARYMFGSSDDVTWRAVSSMIWGQIALGLSVLTVCIPSLKGLIDSLLGSTAVAALNTPYELKSSANGTGLEMTALSDSKSRRASKYGSGLGSDRRKSSKVRHSHQPTWRHDITSEVRTEIASGSDSVRNLTEGVMVNTDFEVSYDDRHASRADSMGSTEAAYHMQSS
ncbi:integral membrane [Fusarium longipes]|uniref:Integral membrane n=1 Tax=Fusarium longipes TaxID=694270 RepID=A0A395SXR4_9HYPO|nr:integral membrane [Fusarium longipes]